MTEKKSFHAVWYKDIWVKVELFFTENYSDRSSPSGEYYLSKRAQFCANLAQKCFEYFHRYALVKMDVCAVVAVNTADLIPGQSKRLSSSL